MTTTYTITDTHSGAFLARVDDFFACQPLIDVHGLPFNTYEIAEIVAHNVTHIWYTKRG